MKTQIGFQNKIDVVKELFFIDRMFVVYVNDIATLVVDTTEDVIRWLEFNWPVGTQVNWRIKP